jgi:hypothetical protein
VKRATQMTPPEISNAPLKQFVLSIHPTPPHRENKKHPHPPPFPPPPHPQQPPRQLNLRPARGSHFDRVLSKLYSSNVSSMWDGSFDSDEGPTRVEDIKWTPQVLQIVEELIQTLKEEATSLQLQSDRAQKRNRCVRVLSLMFTSCVVLFNTSALSTSEGLNEVALKALNIALTGATGFLAGIEGIYQYNKQAYQLAEAALALEGLSRTLRVQLVSPVLARRDPTELLLFVESTRDKIMKKVLHINDVA